VVTTWLRKSQFPNDDPHYAGVLGYGAHPAAEAAVRGADLIVALGCRFSEFTSRRWTLVPPGTAVIQVDIDAEEIGRTVPVTVGLQADAALAAESIRQILGTSPGAPVVPARQAWRRELRSRYETESRRPGGADPGADAGKDADKDAGPSAQPVPSAALVAELQAAVDRHRALLVQDVHTFGPWIARYLQIREPGSYFAAAGGSMGWGLPAALGIQVARPERRVIAVLGDGSFWMVAQDLETAVREGLPVICVVVNNFAYGNTRDRQRIAHGGRYLGVFYGNPDFAAFARLLGAHGERVEKSGDLPGAIDRAVASGKPAVIDVVQDSQEGLPPGMVPPAARPS
jgi:acetolactate synthase-1/2/3 large subunit